MDQPASMLSPGMPSMQSGQQPACQESACMVSSLLRAGMVSGVVLDVPGDRSAELLKTSTEDANPGLGFQISGK